VPLQIGAVDMLSRGSNMVSYQSYFIGGTIMLASFFIPGGRQVRLDVVFAARDGADLGHKSMGRPFGLSDGFPDYLVASWRGEFHRERSFNCAPPA